ncbi:hypothetical protein LTR27_008973 [Elasticomyces elasticus]|nr:hypothetical protein LTR27_008973 [Elasticomyces elasticus]
MVARSNSTTEKEMEIGEQAMKGNVEEETYFPLLDLPAEMWSYICRLAVAQPSPIMLDGNSMSRDLFRSLVVQPAITQVCKSIREETIGTFYSSTFVYTEEIGGNGEPDGNLWAWFRCICPQYGDYHPRRPPTQSHD